MLGGGEWVRAADDPDRQDDVVFLDDALENPGDLAFSLVLTTSRLLPNRFPEDRKVLADRVVEMREAYLTRRTEPIQYRIDGIVVYPRKGKP